MKPFTKVCLIIFVETRQVKEIYYSFICQSYRFNLKELFFHDNA